MNEKNDDFKITVKSNTKDLFAFTKLVPKRKKRIHKAPAEPLTSDPINDLARKLHPIRQYLVIDEIKDETKTTKTYKLVSDPDFNTEDLAFFRAGQYLSLKVDVNGVRITRPYSISSSPKDALNGFYEITIRKEQHGFLTEHAWENWKVGTKITSSGPEGLFYYDNLRDCKQIVGLAGGSGITPFRSIAKDIIDENSDAKLVVLYGSSDEEDIIFYEEFNELEKEYPDKFKAVFVLSCEEVTLEGCEQGFLTSEIIKKYADANNSSFFICGPQIMYNFVEKELEKLNIPPKRIRREAYGEIKDIVKYPGFPQEVAEKTFNIKVSIGEITKEIPGIATESVLVAMERANLAPPSKCRSGECGFCRSLLISGDVYVSPACDGRREADKKFNYFHPCSSYPISDIEIQVPRSLD
ncbi:MAG: 2Fe-2S iron-sulfur cluster binding domain-containing protein [Candidatus Lokiarchaeota archaeon]|nr:2Fe-2S iron-sulfur cluster binding domain-containing protein [Candidatus Lokiarchaeota archaeon]MBD3339961.1 2Fe-2S iron-sulfur cluster binding domain-containing protein [Candidatus Lokiarchaeota archaeon]